MEPKNQMYTKNFPKCSILYTGYINETSHVDLIYFVSFK